MSSASDFVIKNGVLEKYRGSDTEVVIPDGVTSIGNWAFSGCSSLTSVTIPDSVTRIGRHVFKNCRRLASITIPDGVKSIGNLAFYGCRSLTSITIPDGMTSIGDLAFYGCRSLTSITIPDGVTSIGDLAFDGCNSLTSIEVSNGNRFYRSADNCLIQKQNKKLVLGCQNSIIPNDGSVKSIGNWAFKGCGSLTSITIPDSVTRIGRRSFYGCSSLTSITIPDSVTSIQGEAFEDCTGLTSITIPKSVKSIGGGAFYGCSSLTSITIPDSVTSIGNWAFEGCTGLTSVTVSEGGDLLALAEMYFNKYLGTGICRQADEATMTKLIARAAKWEKAKRDAFYEFYLHSDTKAAMLLAEKRKEFAKYAELRGMDEDELRDSRLSDLGLDMNRCKQYDLGNQAVTVRMASDFTFTVETPDGKTAKSLPKKGADPKKFEAASADFAEIKKNVKKIWKNRADLLLKDFVSGKERTPECWKKTYGGNPILHGVACLIVWEQGGDTFTRTDAGPIRSDGSAYELTDKPIRVAHPMEMDRKEIESWQTLFSSHGLKQPFAQIWERVHTADEISPDRYKGCPILFFALQGADKHGFNEKLKIPGCEIKEEWSSMPAPNGKTTSWCDIQSFKIKKYSRAVNHAVAYLDRVTVLGRIEKDDLSAMDYVDGCNIAQITDYIAAAQKGHAASVLAALLEYKNANFADFDPMAEFTLEW